MPNRTQLELTPDTWRELLALAEHLGYSPEMAATYAIRLVNACLREGLLTDDPSALWPAEARTPALGETGTAGGKVIPFPGVTN